MEILNIKNLSFKYYGADENTFENINFSVNKGEIVLICGKSGCGKTTLLKMLKPQIAPYGEKNGEILFNNEDLFRLDEGRSASKIGFVMQDPDSQIISDRVWYELAFGLQNIGLESSLIKRRIAEMSGSFGIDKWIEKNTYELSGGQKQILNLASVMAMDPELLILDEPTSQLDPVSASEFIRLLKKLNEEKNTTIIIVEHRLEEIFSLASKVIFIDKKTANVVSSPTNILNDSLNIPDSFLPIFVRLFKDLQIEGECPLTIKQTREFLQNNFKKASFHLPPKNKTYEPLLEIKNLCFRYEKHSQDILKNLDLTVNKNEIISVLGGNGQGKTTLLKVISSILKPYSGKVKIKDKLKISYLSQNPTDVFLKDTVRLDFEAVSSDYKEFTERFSITPLLDRHPFDLSCGQQQKCAVVKLLLTKPDVILLDETTKGLDEDAKKVLKDILLELKKQGKTVVLSTHDVEFAAKISDRCALLFNKEIVCCEEAHKFFFENIFYTTVSSLVSIDVFENVTVYDDLLKMCQSQKGGL